MKIKIGLLLMLCLLALTGCQDLFNEQNSSGIIMDVQTLKKAIEDEANNQKAEAESEQNQEAEAEPETNPEQETEQEPVQDTEPQEEVLNPMPELPQTKKLTLLVYMAADNDLEGYAISDLKEMEHAVYSNLNVLVLLDRVQGGDATNGDWTDTRLFEIVHDPTDGNYIVSTRLRCPNLSLSAATETELDMANPSVLHNFITFAKNEYEAEKYALVIWGHGTGWRGDGQLIETTLNRAVAIDDTTNSYMSVPELGKALKNLGLCVTGFDTCFGGVFENVYEIKNCSEYTVASPDVTPARGWDYKQLLEDLSESDFSTRNIAQIMAASSSVTTTVFVNSRLRNVMGCFEAFSEELSKTIVDKDSHAQIFDQINELIKNHKAYYYSHGKSDVYLDMYCFAQTYSQSANSRLAEAAVKLKNELNRAALSTYSEFARIGINYIPRTEIGSLAVQHSPEYLKDFDNASQGLFIKESQWWVPTRDGNSGSVLDKLFYTAY